AIVNRYLMAFWAGDFDSTQRLVAEDFVFRGPLAQADSRQEFFASAMPLAGVVRGHELLRQWADGNDVCSFYCFNIQTPAGVGSILTCEWNAVRDERVAAAQLVFDTAAFRSLMPARGQGRAKHSRHRRAGMA
ncbi:MAG: nuclear transport factor 2 family protein, partial [Candidatus Saccharimonadales bacterium]